MAAITFPFLAKIARSGSVPSARPAASFTSSPRKISPISYLCTAFPTHHMDGDIKSPIPGAWIRPHSSRPPRLRRHEWTQRYRSKHIKEYGPQFDRLPGWLPDSGNHWYRTRLVHRLVRSDKTQSCRILEEPIPHIYSSETLPSSPAWHNTTLSALAVTSSLTWPTPHQEAISPSTP